ncbi:MAG: hypothetical protein ABJB74_20250 [Gemmatimonas sp.]
MKEFQESPEDGVTADGYVELDESIRPNNGGEVPDKKAETQANTTLNVPDAKKSA